MLVIRESPKKEISADSETQIAISDSITTTAINQTKSDTHSMVTPRKNVNMTTQTEAKTLQVACCLCKLGQKKLICFSGTFFRKRCRKAAFYLFFTF